MKSLYEGILGDIDDTIARSDKASDCSGSISNKDMDAESGSINDKMSEVIYA